MNKLITVGCIFLLLPNLISFSISSEIIRIQDFKENTTDIAFNKKIEKLMSGNDPIKILFIGSSYFNFNNLPYIFESLAVSSGKNVHIEQRIPNGWYLDNHANSNETEMIINKNNWDFVILQGGGTNTAYPDYFTEHPVLPALEILKNKIYENCESSKIIFCLPWAFEDGMTWYNNWTDTYKDMQIKILNNTIKFCKEIGLKIAPVGWSWYKVLEEMNYPLHYLHKSDWNHPSRKGSYLMACVIYSTVFLKSTTGIPYYNSILEEEAIYFQNVSSKTVFDNLSLWNLVDENDSTPPNINIIYPNPGLYFFNKKIINLSNNIIAIGAIDIVADAYDFESGIEHVEYELVRFPLFIIGIFQYDSYIYRLNKLSLGRWFVTITAYDNNGNKAFDKIEILKYL